MSGWNPPDVARQRACAPVWGRLHALYCHKIVRALRSSDEFNTLVNQGLAVPLFNGPRLRPDQCDYAITARGTARAEILF